MKIEINIPFDGFYNSLYSEEVDSQGDFYVECYREDGGKDAVGVAEALYKYTDYSSAYVQVAKYYTDAFNRKFEEWSGVDLELEFVEMTSPREYNFTTDRIFAKASLEALKTLRQQVDASALREEIRDRFTSRSGFISHYSNDLDDWPEEIAEWDHNQMCTLLMAFLPEDWGMGVYYETFYGDEAYTAWSGAVNWEAFDEEMKSITEGV